LRRRSRSYRIYGLTPDVLVVSSRRCLLGTRPSRRSTTRLDRCRCAQSSTCSGESRACGPDYVAGRAVTCRLVTNILPPGGPPDRRCATDHNRLAHADGTVVAGGRRLRFPRRSPDLSSAAGTLMVCAVSGTLEASSAHPCDAALDGVRLRCTTLLSSRYPSSLVLCVRDCFANAHSPSTGRSYSECPTLRAAFAERRSRSGYPIGLYHSITAE